MKPNKVIGIFMNFGGIMTLFVISTLGEEVEIALHLPPEKEFISTWSHN